MHAMHHFSRKHVTVTATCTEPPGRTANRKHGAFECLCSLRSRKSDIFTDLQSTAPKFQCRYCLQVSCSKLILNTIPGAAPFILQCLTFGCPLQQAPRLPVIILMGHVNMQTRKEKKKNHGQTILQVIRFMSIGHIQPASGQS